MSSPRRAYEAKLAELNETLLSMSRAAEDMLRKALVALQTRDVALADEAIRDDDRVDFYNHDIENRCLKLIATQQPAARDLRVIFAALGIATDVERVGDYAVDIAKTAKRLADRPLFKPLVDIPHMADLVRTMLERAIEGFVSRDLSMVKAMIDMDDDVDHLYKALHEELVDFMKQDAGLIDQCVQLLLITRYLERVADHITNIGERVYYVETGELKELHQ
ncbi:MAG: phosphate signaling complex protein PhoU [Chloroflexota bacterium]